MLKNRAFVKEIFEDFGYIEVEACEPTELKKYVEDHFITMKSTGRNVGACEEFRFTGTYSMLKKMYKENWDESAYDKEIREMFHKL